MLEDSRPVPRMLRPRDVVRSMSPALCAVALASGVINLLMLTAPLFMLQVYDRVLPSRSGATLLGLSLFALVLFLFQGLFEVVRGRMLSRIARIFVDRVTPSSVNLLVDSQDQEGVQALRDVDELRSFISGGLSAFFDLPWTPLYIGLCFAFHYVLGLAVLTGAVVLSGLTWIGDRASRRPIKEVVGLATSRNRLTEEIRRNRVQIDALGMRGRMRQLLLERSGQYLDRYEAASSVTLHLGAATRIVRIVLQSGVLALGAWLVIHGQATGGIMLAATILTIRALAPLEQAMANWRSFVAARQAWVRLDTAIEGMPQRGAPTPIELPSREITFSGVTVAAPGTQRVVVADANFMLEAGSALGVLGPSGSGKSSLARALVGAWVPVRGVIRLDGATFDQWERDKIGRAVGYLPQDVELFAGTVAENIARFEENAPIETLHRAAAQADVHDLIRRLPNGYDTQVGEGGAMLSGGQRQRIGLARALYGDPFLVVLDEPNSNLDASGEQALLRAIISVRQRGGVVVVIAHRANVLAAVNQLMILNEGRVQQIGMRDEVLATLAAGQKKPDVMAPETRVAPPHPPRKRKPRSGRGEGSHGDAQVGA